MINFQRLIKTRVEESLLDTPVVLITGPRRAGKTTLVRSLTTDERQYLTLDDQTTLEAARADPTRFIRGIDWAIIDEIQRAPELMLAIKKSVDEDYRPGRFLLTGSANIMTLPRVADSLAGRIETLRLLPLAQVEIMGGQATFLEKLFNNDAALPNTLLVGDPLIECILRGGFPEAINKRTEKRRADWSNAYLETVLTRDLREIADIEKFTELPRFFRLLAEHSSQTLNYTTFGSAININHKTSRRYVELLETIFLLATVQPWFTNTIKRIVKTPKLHIMDTGILSASRGLTADQVLNDRNLLGTLLETFVFTEILKLLSSSDQRIRAYHLRDHSGKEVDIVLERNDGAIAGIEVKSTAQVQSKDFEGLRLLKQATKNKFKSGIVLYDGDTIVPFDKDLKAVPISALWV